MEQSTDYGKTYNHLYFHLNDSKMITVYFSHKKHCYSIRVHETDEKHMFILYQLHNTTAIKLLIEALILELTSEIYSLDIEILNNLAKSYEELEQLHYLELCNKFEGK